MKEVMVLGDAEAGAKEEGGLIFQAVEADWTKACLLTKAPVSGKAQFSQKASGAAANR
jgi:hypothetical protein